ncbi:unnamed protein product [Rotaria sp. Silwood2]|nr:unnamed protein product [Rotaria sp. Silwood2]CAF4109812.1 unnamed protein product [Rotaria sp. Silwood2]
MSTVLIAIILLTAQFVPAVDAFLFGQPKLECKPCVCHPECHCETKCVQQQIMNECNLGTDLHNALASHHTQAHQTTRFILIFSLIVNVILTIILLFRKTVCNCYRAHRLQKQQKKAAKEQAAALQQTNRYAIALKQMLPPRTEQCLSDSTGTHTTSDQPLFQLLSNLNINNSVQIS